MSHKSEYAEPLGKVYSEMVAVMEGVRAKTMTADDGEAIAKAGHVAHKTIESDLHARIFGAKLARQTLPPPAEAEKEEKAA